MSLREEYTGVTAAKTAAADPLNAPLSKAATDIAHDLRVMRRTVEAQSGRGLKRFFAGLKAGRPCGERDPDAKTVSFYLGKKTIELSESYWSSTREVAEELKQTVGAHLYGADYIEAHLSPRAEYHYEGKLCRAATEKVKNLQPAYLSQARGLPAYAEIHALCADPNVDIRVELVLEHGIGHKKDIFEPGGGYTWERGADKARATINVAMRLYLNEPYSASSDAAFFAAKKPPVAAIVPRA